MAVRFEDQLNIQAGSASTHAATKGQVDAAEANAKNRANHTGTQTVATLSDFQSAVDARVQLVVDAAPAALDTLNELAAALGDDPNFSATLTTQLNGLDSRLDALEGAPAGSRSMSATIGNGSLSSFPVTHNWALADKNKVAVEVVDTTTGETVYARVVRTDTNTVTVSFGTAVPAANQYRVLLREVTG